MDRCIGESWVRWWRGFGSVEIGELPMSPMSLKIADDGLDVV